MPAVSLTTIAAKRCRRARPRPRSAACRVPHSPSSATKRSSTRRRGLGSCVGASGAHRRANSIAACRRGDAVGSSTRARVLSGATHSANDAAWRMLMASIGAACVAMSPAWPRTKGRPRPGCNAWSGRHVRRLRAARQEGTSNVPHGKRMDALRESANRAGCSSTEERSAAHPAGSSWVP